MGRERSDRENFHQSNINTMNAKLLHTVAWILVTVGALNWGLIGIGAFMGESWNLVAMLLSSWPEVEWLVYVLVGAAAVYGILTHKKTCRLCSA